MQMKFLTALTAAIASANALGEVCIVFNGVFPDFFRFFLPMLAHHFLLCP